MKALQNVYILILNPVSKAMAKVSPSVRNTVLTAAFFFLFCTYFIYHSTKYFGWDIRGDLKNALGYILLIILILFSIKGPLRQVKWNPVFVGLWFSCGILTIVAGLDHDVGKGFMSIPILMVMLLPILYFVWGNRGDYNILFRCASIAVIASFLLYLLLCIYFAPLVETAFGLRYNGTIKNPNFLALITVTVVASSLYLLTASQKLKVLYMFTCGVAISIAFFTMSRTSALAILALLILWSIRMVKDGKFAQVSRRETMKKILALILVVVICVPITYSLLTYGNQGLRYLSGDTKNMHYTSMADMLALSVGRAEVGNESMNTLSAGRLEIWSSYMNRTTLLGNDVKKTVKEVNRGRWTRSAHNTYLEVSYRAGLITGFLSLAIAVWSGVYVLKVIFAKKKLRDDSLFVALIAASFCIASMLESLSFPYMRSMTFLYCITLAPLFNRREE